MRNCVLIQCSLLLLSASTSYAEPLSSFSEARLRNFSQPNSIVAYSDRGDHYEALRIAKEKDVSDLEISETLSAARSAWALGLTDDARNYWLSSLSDSALAGSERYRAMLASAALELQEKNFDGARAIAERATLELESSELRSQFYLIIADSLRAQRALGLAEEYYSRAVEEAHAERKTEARYLQAECQYQLGKLDKARQNLVLIENSSVFSSVALMRLISIDLALGNYKGITTWVEAGRKRAPSIFRGSWPTYAYVAALLQLQQVEEAKIEVNELKARVSEDDTWYMLAESSLEAKLVENLLPARAMLRRPETPAGENHE